MYLTGTEGDDILIGTADDDTLEGLGGNDDLQGGDGDDLLIGGPGNDKLNGGAGNDTVSYADATSVPAMSFLMIHLGGSAWELGPTPSPWSDTLVSIENAIGSAGVDWMVGTSGDNKLYGGAGDDKIEGKGGADVLDGGGGGDSLSTDSYFDPTQAGSLMIGGDGDDSLVSGNSNDTMMGGAGNDSFSVMNFATTRVVDGGAGADTLTFSDNIFTSFSGGVVVDLNKSGSQTVASGVAMTITGVENLTGSSAGDILIGDAGANGLNGGNGDDLLMGGAGNDKLDGGAGSDTVSYADVAGAGMLLINLSAQSVTIMGPAGFENDVLVSIENAIGSSGEDWLIGSSGDNHLIGGAGNDNIDGKGGSDILEGGDGNDLIATTGIFGAAAPGSQLIGGDGNDAIQSGNSNDTLLGGAGDDALSVGNYATTRIVDGGDGTDLLAFSSGFTSGVTVDLGQTTQAIAPGVVITLTHVENVNGTEAGDTLIGDAGANLMYGWGGDDWLYGGGGNDALNGVEGADHIVGGAGQDQLRGGDGADIFVFAPGDSDYSAPDTIHDFTAEDRLLFTDGPAGDAGNYAELETTDFLAVDALFAADGVRYVAMTVGSDLYVFADTGEEGTTYDSFVVLTGANLSSIDAGSFLAA